MQFLEPVKLLRQTWLKLPDICPKQSDLFDKDRPQTNVPRMLRD